MVKCPRIPTFDLKGIDAKIQLLQIALADNLSWLEYSFGKAERYEKSVEDKTVVYPAVFVDNTTDPQDVRPNDNYKSYAFWEITDPGQIIYPEDSQYSKVKYADWEYNVSCILWINLKRIDDSNYNETKSQMRQDIIDVFETKLLSVDVMFEANQIFERDINQIFAGYNLENSENVIKDAYIAFRIDGVIRFNRECPVDNSYSVTNCE